MALLEAEDNLLMPYDLDSGKIWSFWCVSYYGFCVNVSPYMVIMYRGGGGTVHMKT